MTSVLEAVREIVRSRTFGRDLADDLTLGEEGLGLDSIAIAEVLLSCEERFGTSVATLLDGQPITIRRIVEHLSGELVA